MSILFYYRYSNRFYETNYFGKISLTSSSTFQKIVSAWGTPEKSTCENLTDVYRFEVMFDGFSVIFIVEEPEIRGNMTPDIYKVYSDRFKFGKDNVGVGSSRNEIESAYEKSYITKKTHSSDENTVVYFDNHILVTYYFDENNVAELIEFFFYF